VLALLLLAVALGLSNLAAAVAIGVSGVRGSTMVRVGVVFGLFEADMPVVGLALGQSPATDVGQAAHVLGGAVLIAVGLVGLVLAGRGPDPVQGLARGARPWRTGRIVATGLALSVDNLAAGFALGTYRTGLAVAAVVFGAVSVAMSLIGLELGAKIGSAAGGRSELLASAILIAVGGALAAGVF
jgi:manganese efflux pump family protein